MKRLLTFLALVAFSAVSLAAVVRVVRTDLAPASHFDHGALETWLVTNDGSDTDVPRLRRAARLLERDFHDDFDWRPFFKSLDPAAQTRFQVNTARLALRVFEQRAERYASLPRYHRERYLDSQLSDFAHWYLLDAKGRKIQGIELFGQETLFAAEHSEAEIAVKQQAAATLASPAAAEFIRDLQGAAVKKLFGRLVPGGREPKRKED